MEAEEHKEVFHSNLASLNLAGTVFVTERETSVANRLRTAAEFCFESELLFKVSG